jgi:hypothetical protein
MMSISGKSASCNCDPAEIVTELTGFVDAAVRDGSGMRDFERGLFDCLLAVGFRLTEEFLQRQGDGDCGDTCESSGNTLYRSEKPVARRLRSIFGEHQFETFVYRNGRHPKTAIASRPVDERLGIGPERYSPLVQEFSMMFCCEHAFGVAAETFEVIFGQKLSVDSLERTSRLLGQQASEFLDSLENPPAEEEGELLVLTADGKGVPMVREDAQRLKACDPKPDRPGNRRMATVGAVYSVDRFVRTAEQILSALFTSADTGESTETMRPEPRHKRYMTKFAEVLPDLGEDPVSGTQLVMAWASRQVEDRHQPEQPLIRLMDGQHSLWDEADAAQAGVPDEQVVDILDLMHVAGYAWTAAKAFCSHQTDQEAFVKDLLLKILQGRVDSVIRSLRCLATRRGLQGSKRTDIEQVCGYFSAHRHRMRYDEYLAEGYPIATGVIEGACRHLVKDRMERSGMKWTHVGARELLHLRCLRASGFWNRYHKQRSTPRHSEHQLCG